MTRLTDEERKAMTELAGQPAIMADPADAYRIVEPTPEQLSVYSVSSVV